jgi:phosphoribosylformylglycinamidine synthase
MERRCGEVVRRLIAENRLAAVHDVSDGGLLVAIAEMALAGGIGASIYNSTLWHDDTGRLFGEGQGRFVVTLRADEDRDYFEQKIEEIQRLCDEAGVECHTAGLTMGQSLEIYTGGELKGPKVTLADLRAAHEGFFPKLMGADAALA